MSTPVTVPSLYSIAKNSWATIAYGSRIKIHHGATGIILHSHSYNYSHPGTSGQQQVTAFGESDENDWWIIKGPHGTPHNYRVGQPVKQGDVIRLQHQTTGRNLHSHAGFPSPLTGQQEVTCYGENGQGDDNDNWRVELDTGGTWETGKRLRLIHINTNQALHSHANYSHPEWTLNQQEVTCFDRRDENDWWSVEPFITSKVFYQGQSYETYALVSIPNHEDTSLPIVMLLHGICGNIMHMSDPAKSPGYNHDRTAPIPSLRDHGWRDRPGIGIRSHELDPLKPVTSWQTALNNAGFRTINYSQANPRDSLGLPIAQLSQLLGDVMNHPKHQGRPFVLLSHSRGGLLARTIVAQPAAERKFDITRIQQLITLHSPHKGSNVADIATSLATLAEYGKRATTFPYTQLSIPFTDITIDIAASFESFYNEVNAPGYQELKVGSDLLKDLETREPVPGVQYATFGGNSTVLSRHRFWEYTLGSKANRSPLTKPSFYWQTEPRELGEYTPENIVRLIANISTPISLPLPSELRNGDGDLLVANASASLPWAPHRTNPLNHAEALWDPNLQQQVISLLKSKAADSITEITYGSRIKLRHWLTNTGLHSHSHNYSHPGTSGQQQVTAFERTDDNDWWIVKGPHGTPDNYRAGHPVQQGDVIRLEHLSTGRNLHSHAGIPSPLTRQQEVTCFGDKGQGDDNDNWRVELQANGKWQRGNQLRLIHVKTNHALHSHAGYAHPAWTLNQQEVTCFDRRDDNDWWSVFAIKSPPKVRDSEEVDEIPVTPPRPIDRPPVHQL